jgi:hypothetical protein
VRLNRFGVRSEAAVMAGLGPAIHVGGPPILQEIVTTWSNATAR